MGFIGTGWHNGATSPANIIHINDFLLMIGWYIDQSANLTFTFASLRK
jgi:hypothetical protein